MNPISVNPGQSGNSSQQVSSSVSVEDIPLILKEEETSLLFDSFSGQNQTGTAITAELLSVEQASRGGGGTGQGMPPEGLFNFNGKLVRALIPQFLADELLIGKSFDPNFSIPVNLIYEGRGDGNSLVFKIMGGQGLSDIMKALDAYGESYSAAVESSLRSILSSQESAAAASSFIPGNISVSAKGNFLFINMGKHNTPGSFAISMVLTAISGKVKEPAKEPVKDDSDSNGGKNPGRIYMMTIEAEPANLGYIKMHCVYSGKTLRMNFQKYSDKTKEIIGKNLKILKEMIESEGLRLGEISFSAGGWKNFPSADSYPLLGKGGGIINERA